jgi:hypothetical protein
MLTADQIAIRDMTRKFVRSEILPNIMQWEEQGVVPKHIWQ